MNSVIQHIYSKPSKPFSHVESSVIRPMRWVVKLVASFTLVMMVLEIWRPPYCRKYTRMSLIEPRLLPVTEEEFELRSTNIEDDSRLNVKAR